METTTNYSVTYSEDGFASDPVIWPHAHEAADDISLLKLAKFDAALAKIEALPVGATVTFAKGNNVAVVEAV